ncbi:MAG TPA: hypothetical protein PLY40_07100 [Bacillota bacterium]|nr:hypothetical protein [Bacillota bacterium]
MSTIAVLLLILGAAAISGYALFARRLWGELVVSTLLWLLAAAYSALLVSSFNLPNPTVLIIDFFRGLYDRLFGTF